MSGKAIPPISALGGRSDIFPKPFLSAPHQRLFRRTGGHFYLEIPLPALHQLFGTERENFLFHKEDFGRFHFALEKWDEFIYTKHGEGRRIHFPIFIKPQLKWSKAHFNLKKNKLVKAPRRPIEYWKIESRTERFNLMNDLNF